MKGKFILSAILCALLLTACADRQAAAPAPAQEPDAASTREPDSARVLLDVSGVDDIFAGLNLSNADLTAYGEETGTYAAGAAIRAEEYLAALRGYTWEACRVPDGWDGDEGYRCELTAPGVTLTAFQSSVNSVRPFRVLTDDVGGWYTLTFMLDEQADWMVYNTFMNWYNEARAAALYGGEGTPLTAEELDWFQDYTAPGYDETWGGVGEAAAISCFFTSHYSDPRDLDAEEFLAYCPDQGTLGPEDEAEFQLVQARTDWRVGEDAHLAALDEMPVPCHRLPRTYIDEILTQYAGITVEDMHTDWREEALYIPETDCFYTFTSDFGPGSFVPVYGEKNGGLVTLWDGGGGADVLTLQSADGGYRILSHQAAANG